MSEHRMSNYRVLRVKQVVEETADARSLVFDVPAELAEQFRYQPGQFLTLRVPHEEGWLPRCYSLSSTPLADEPLRVTIKRVVDGRASNWLCDAVEAGDELQVMAPGGVFVPRDLNGDLLLFGGGSGVTPLLSILRSALLVGQGRILLIYANRDQDSVIFRDVLKALASAHPSRLRVVHWLDSLQGIPQVEQLAELARPLAHAEAFICGPGPFMDAASQALQRLRVPRGRIHIERFVSLPGEGERQPLASIETVVAAQVRVALDGAHHELDCQRGETLLQAMERAGLKPPSSCRVGGCASCMCTLEQGSAQLLVNDVLDATELAEGWILCCQAVPTSDVLHIRFPE